MARKTVIELIGEENVIEAKPTMGGEDFAYYLEKVPGAFLELGTGNPEKGTDKPHHNPNMAPSQKLFRRQYCRRSSTINSVKPNNSRLPDRRIPGKRGKPSIGTTLLQPTLKPQHLYKNGGNDNAWSSNAIHTSMVGSTVPSISNTVHNNTTCNKVQ